MDVAKTDAGKQQFIQRTKVISLWRRIVKDCARIADANQRKETLGFAREEFERHRNVTDIVCCFRILFISALDLEETAGRKMCVNRNCRVIFGI